MPISRTLNQHFFKTWSPGMAYVLGYFAADGSMIKNKRGAHFVEFTTTDKILLNILQTVIGSNHIISKRPIRNKKWKQQYRLQIGSKEWFQDLANLGFTQSKSNMLSFPEVPKEDVPHFVRGYFDGDGGVYFKQHFVKARDKAVWVFSAHFTSGSEQFLRSLFNYLKHHGISGGSLKEKERGFELVFSRRDSIALYRLMYHTTPTAGLFLPRKRKVFEMAMKTLYGGSFVNNLRA